MVQPYSQDGLTLQSVRIITLHYMSFSRRFYPKRLTGWFNPYRVFPQQSTGMNVCVVLQASFEGRVVVVCEKMMSQPCWASSNQLVHSKNSRGMTLLHLAAAEGYAGLIQTLVRWR